MRVSRKLLYVVAFIGVAATAAIAVGRMIVPSAGPALVWVAIVAAAAGAPGLFRRRAWPLALALLPAGALLFARARAPAPPAVRGVEGHWAFYADQVGAGVRTYASGDVPFDLAVAPGLELLLTLAVFAAVGAASLLALGLRRPLPAIACLLVPLGWGLTIDTSERVVWLPLAFLFLSASLLAFHRSLQRESWRPGDLLAGGTTAVIASVLALALLGATPVAEGQPWQDWRSWGSPGGGGRTRLVFDWMQNYPDLLDPAKDADIMSVTSPVAAYWRANALDTFTGSTWFTAQPALDRLETRGATGVTYELPVPSPGPSGRPVVVSVRSTALSTDYLFTAGVPRTLVLDRRREVFMSGVDALWAEDRIGPPLEYTLTTVVPQVKPADLIGRGRDYPEHLRPYLLLPVPVSAELSGADPEGQWRAATGATAAQREWQGLYALNRDVVDGATDPYEVALAIERHLRAGYTYSLTPRASEMESPYAAFLFETRTGYCQHFAGAMAAILRFNGVPSRVAVGFATGSRIDDDTFVVSRDDAHAWVEVYFPGVGWVPFDPTPGRSLPGDGASSTNAGFLDPFAGEQAPDEAVEQATESGARAPQQDPGSGQGAVGPGGSAAPSSTPWVVWAAALAAVAAAWPAARALLRRSRLWRGDPERRLSASLSLLRAELEDFGAGVPSSCTLDELARRLKLTLDVDAAGVMGRVQAVLFGGRPATQRDIDDVARLRRELRRRFRVRRGWMRTVAALYGLPMASANSAPRARARSSSPSRSPRVSWPYSTTNETRIWTR